MRSNRDAEFSRYMKVKAALNGHGVNPRASEYSPLWKSIDRVLMSNDGFQHEHRLSASSRVPIQEWQSSQAATRIAQELSGHVGRSVGSKRARNAVLGVR